MSTRQIRLSGAGGQGLVLAGIILAEAAMRAGYNVAVAQSYGPEARLGASRAEVIISTEKIAYPQVDKPDVLLCLSQEAFDKYLVGLGEEALVLVDSSQVLISTNHRKPKIIALPLQRAAMEQVGSKLVTNVVALGALNALAGIVSWEHLATAVAARTPSKYRDQNLKALDVGRALASGASLA
ncbi:MAG: 2-oxoacid:acceptor oxidoreductase family protein [Candidatus Bipolaricaulota bacterium]|nr:2-oxoacid:acceptor oxidoreductase family protein [Candidatus Bipolaricaulota bacterium]MCS7274097.1 2-oxoacid:acceptor oxidoreductase family protein [Candidatus Bipolaricaulota bacterium]MDW8110694.1 2-oxoacid:acceptor oxidoreductase family protein [Candidatus Bipolaricaulota bacterium]MDW8328448.1 2-oxoacid:acceptor oxidoreductase family protein [Candidatus Bipolaricaulota bacterium]